MAHEHLDEKLINSLLGDGRSSLRSLAEELDVSVTTVSNHLKDLEADGVVKGYSPIVDYESLGYDVTAIMHLKVEGSALPEITNKLEAQKQMISVYETTGDYDIIAIGKFGDTDDMNDQIKSLLEDVDIRESNTSVVLNAVKDNEQFELDIPE
ncbi:MAG: HTH-type transcriptional regulator Lrp [Bacteroidales bacterium]|nr:HTH-type transcriptional regulator Lrp [Bacteroidales bacterium]